ncbi:ribose-phosphate pyrophosphokinase [Pseudoduganella danionis]|uniref:Ribose-phosphate pyrophosphokinase n=3 Tax=Telluria group TaxID=2895353 RepID=A0A845HYZ1_9BURK|nr:MULTISPECIES: ribose-phosphate pyrophosphokinase [Telluria group]MTW35007.1 ribose-phosphate diphosphokinase [Pseudoduganella danionis]MYM41646.1 ribose-phosphate diphosphokinase [Duganella qianjiadongensis]MYN46594.1 ribose-phosphate diphosphokinase [Duganella fentianensis]
MAFENLMVFTGNANPALAEGVVKNLGIPLGKANVSKFSDGEVMVEINENVRGKDVFVLQSTCAPTNDSLMELILMVDALKRASAGRITAAIPYFGYARQDRRPRSARVAISAKVVANMLEEAGVERVLIMDLHADQIQGFFDIPVDNIYASPVLLGDLQKKNYQDLLVVSPDVGGVVRARALAKRLGCDLAIIDKRRPKANVSEVMNIIGEVEGRNCVIMDDMVDTAGTLVKAAEVLKERGAKKVIAYCTHPVLSGPAIERITTSSLDELVVTDTIPLSEAAKACDKIRQLTCAPLLAETFKRIVKGDSVISLFID